MDHQVIEKPFWIVRNQYLDPDLQQRLVEVLDAAEAGAKLKEPKNAQATIVQIRSTLQKVVELSEGVI